MDKFALQNQFQRRQNFLIKLNDAIRPVADATTVQEIITQLGREFFEAERCYYAEIIDNVAIVRKDAHEASLAPLAGNYPLDDFHLFKSIIESGAPFIVSDTSHSAVLDEKLRAVCIQADVISFINIPVTKDGLTVGFLSITQSTPRDWTDFEIQIAKELSEISWAAIDRVNYVTALRKSELKYHTLFDSISDGFCIIEVLFDKNDKPYDYRFLEANPAFREQTGLTNFIGKTILELAPSMEKFWFDMYGSIAVSGESKTFEHEARALQRWYQVSAFKTGDMEQPFVAVLFRDISHKKQAENTLLQLLKQKEKLISIAKHKLQRPLSSIESYAGELEHRKGAETSSEDCEIIRQLNLHIDQLSQMVDNLLNNSIVLKSPKTKTIN